MSQPVNENARPDSNGVQIRRLGQFDGPVVPPTTRHEDEPEDQEEQESEGTSRVPSAALVALILLFLGIIITSVGVGLWAGIGPGLITLGVGMFFVGFQIARDND